VARRSHVADHSENHVCRERVVCPSPRRTSKRGKMRLWIREVRQLIRNSIDIVEKILSGNSSEVWSENDESSSIHRTTSQSFQPISRQNVNITRLFQSPLKFLYYFYIWLPLFWCTLGMEYLKLTLQVSARRSSKLYMILRQINSFYIQGLLLSPCCLIPLVSHRPLPCGTSDELD
jgi:hypothetical protein